jgi:arginyl-tRNA synthetase
MLDRLTQVLSELVPQADFSVIPLHNPRSGADAQVFSVERLNAAREALATLPDVAVVRTRGRSLTVRFADTAVAQLGVQLEQGVADVLDARDLMGGTEVVVNFCDANPTKALHVGHLRNIALGQALAGALSAAGAHVTRQSQVSDYCRSMGEAMAGYMELPAHTTPRSLGVKSDHFVGECFGRYAADRAATSATGDPADDTEDPALSAEAAVRNDLADELLERLRGGEPAVVACWERLREWALRGQEATLAALGVSIDRYVYESDSRPLTRWILDKGLAGSVLTRTADGAVVYETREQEYPRLLLARADGFPTQHLRTFALWHSLRQQLGGVRTIELVGEEWNAYVRYHHRLMHGERQSSPPGCHPSDNVIYGMVTVAGAAVKSSHGRPPLVDGVLERLVATRPLQELASRSEGRLTPRSLAALVTLGLYLGRPTRKPVDLTLNEMLDLTGGIGWELARAAVSAWAPRHDGPPDPDPGDAEYRHTVMQSQVHRRLLARTVEQLDVYELARFYGHLSRRFLASDAQARTARAMRTLLAAGLGSLGLPCAQPEAAAP